MVGWLAEAGARFLGPVSQGLASAGSAKGTPGSPRCPGCDPSKSKVLSAHRQRSVNKVQGAMLVQLSHPITGGTAQSKRMLDLDKTRPRRA